MKGDNKMKVYYLECHFTTCIFSSLGKAVLAFMRCISDKYPSATFEFEETEDETIVTAKAGDYSYQAFITEIEVDDWYCGNCE